VLGVCINCRGACIELLMLGVIAISDIERFSHPYTA
jgi:hypothetical protein